MKKQPHGAERRARKSAGVKDLAPRAKKASRIKAGALDTFATGVEAPRSTQIKWIEIQSVSWSK